MGRVLFTSEHDLERSENLRAVWNAYDGEKDFVRGIWHMSTAPQDGYSVVVCDSLPAYMPDKRDCKSIVIGHGIEGGKLYALDEKRSGIDKRAFWQIDVSVNASTKTVDIMQQMFGLPREKVATIGMPRSDAYIGKRKGDGGTVLADYQRAYLYVPTFRGPNDGDRLPRIDWAKLDSMLDADEVIAVKRHYFQRDPIVNMKLGRVIEFPNDAASAPYLIDCDVLITDYSSIIFDGYLLGKPSVLTVDDMAAYMETRGMYLDYPYQYSSRWLCAEGNEEKLLEHMRAAFITGMRQTERSCIDFVADMCDGHSSERVYSLIKELACEC